MALPYKVTRGSWQHWAGRLILFGGVALFIFRAATQWSRSGQGLLTDALIIAIAVTGLNLITGYTGQLSLGHATFFAIGAYISAMLVTGKVTTPFFEDNLWTPGWTLPVVAVTCFLVGCVVGIPALRLKGIYLALVTIVFVEAVRSILKYAEVVNITGGSPGIKGLSYLPPSWTGLDGRADLNKWFLYLAAFFLVLATLISSGLLRSRIGRGMVATREQRDRRRGHGRPSSPRSRPSCSDLRGDCRHCRRPTARAQAAALVEPDVPKFGSSARSPSSSRSSSAVQRGDGVRSSERCSTCPSTTTPVVSGGAQQELLHRMMVGLDPTEVNGLAGCCSE